MRACSGQNIVDMLMGILRLAATDGTDHMTPANIMARVCRSLNELVICADLGNSSQRWSEAGQMEAQQALVTF